jgi:hypothetical protein
MKNLLLLSLIAISFYSCSKNNAATPTPPGTWITGKWQMTAAYDDTVLNNSKPDPAVYLDRLTFASNGTAQSQGLGVNAIITYSLSTMTVSENGEILHIVELSNTSMALVSYGTIYTSRYMVFKKL